MDIKVFLLISIVIAAAAVTIFIASQVTLAGPVQGIAALILPAAALIALVLARRRKG